MRLLTLTLMLLSLGHMANAQDITASGEPTPLTITPAPVSTDAAPVSPETQAQIDDALAKFASNSCMKKWSISLFYGLNRNQADGIIRCLRDAQAINPQQSSVRVNDYTDYATCIDNAGIKCSGNFKQAIVQGTASAIVIAKSDHYDFSNAQNCQNIYVLPGVKADITAGTNCGSVFYVKGSVTCSSQCTGEGCGCHNIAKNSIDNASAQWSAPNFIYFSPTADGSQNALEKITVWEMYARRPNK